MRILRMVLALVIAFIFTSCSVFTSKTITQPTVSTDESKKLVRDLLENNAGCRLPCWWGITPGKTTWNEAQEILENTSLSISEQESGEVFSVGVHAYLPYPYTFAKYMEHRYGIKNGTVDYIHVYNFDLAPNYYLSNFLTTYGQPTEIWMRTYSKYEMGLHPFLIDLFYQDKGILIEYSSSDPPREIDGKLQNCLVREMDSPFIFLWSPEQYSFSFDEAKRKFLDVNSLPEPKPLLEVTGMDINTFYATFKNYDSNTCLETDKKLWP